ncbi:MAG TPA: methyl-coenzyme M reductase subunit beta, partial [Methanomassiliicoccaceae archaeon]|nr:methyl-coenzyme M reductase subunit beta [Methanomassiliicoccaceae archaeon]
MAKYKDKLIEKDVPLDAINPLYNPAIQRIVSLAKRTIAVDLAGIEKGLKTGRVAGGYIKGKEIDVEVVANADKIAKRVKDILKVDKDDDTDVHPILGGKRLVVQVPTRRVETGVEYTTGFTAAAAAVTQAIIDEFGIDMFHANMVKTAVWGRYPQTINFLGSNVKSILEVPQNNEGAGYALRNIMANHVVALASKNSLNAAAISSIFEQTAMFELGDAIGPFERYHLLGLAYQGLNANNLTVDLVKECGKNGTVGDVVGAIVGRAIEDKVIKVKEKL